MCDMLILESNLNDILFPPTYHHFKDSTVSIVKFENFALSFNIIYLIQTLFTGFDITDINLMALRASLLRRNPTIRGF